MLDQKAIQERIRAALAEDLQERGDVTTNAIFSENAQGKACVVAKQIGVISGMFIFEAVFQELGPVTARQLVPEGARVVVGERVMELEGSVRTLLAGERTALNFLQHLSGIATATREMVNAVGELVQVCDTRKTIPLWRDLEKYAVRCGGGVNHRMGLDDMVMIKDTHADGAGGLAEALRRVSEAQPSLRIAAEARTMEEVKIALEGDVDLIMLDNMSIEEMREAIALIDDQVMTEVTGGVTLEKARELALLGIDRVSVGSITHSVKAMDLSMRLEEIIHEE